MPCTDLCLEAGGGVGGGVEVVEQELEQAVVGLVGVVVPEPALLLVLAEAALLQSHHRVRRRTLQQQALAPPTHLQCQHDTNIIQHDTQ